MEKSIEISYDSNIIKMQSFGYPRGRPLIATIRNGKDGGLDGKIYSINKKEQGLLKETIHSLAHKYNISTGNLL